jgi:hypothetical protein
MKPASGTSLASTSPPSFAQNVTGLASSVASTPASPASASRLTAPPAFAPHPTAATPIAMAAIEITSVVRGIGVLSAGGFDSVVMAYTQIPRHTRLQLLGMGALTLSQFGAASGPEQSNEPVPGAGDTHDGGGGGDTHRPLASEYSQPSGQTRVEVRSGMA